MSRPFNRFFTDKRQEPVKEFSEDDQKRMRRMLSRGIVSVRELVDRYNKSDDTHRKLLLPWLKDFIKYIDDTAGVGLRGGRFLEYAELANVSIHSEKDKEFLQNLLESLSKRIKEENDFSTEHLFDALHDVLMRMDPKAFENRGIKLRQLVDNLIAALEQQGDVPDHLLARHRTPIYAIHQALFLLKNTPGYKLTEKIQIELFQNIEKCQIVGIEKNFYPYHYQCRLVKQGILRLTAKTEKPPWIQRLHASLYACWGGMYFLHMLKGLCALDCDPSAAEGVMKNLIEARRRLNMLTTEVWYDKLQAYHESIIKSPMDAAGVESETILKEVPEKSAKDLLFGILRELSTAVLSDHESLSSESSTLASTCFERLSSTLDMLSAKIGQQDFKNDPSFLEPVLNALCEIYIRNSDYREKTWSILERLALNQEFQSKKLLPSWAKDEETLETHIRDLSRNLKGSRHNILFHEVRSNLAWWVDDEDLTTVAEALKKAYTKSDPSSVNQHLSRNRIVNNVVVFLQMRSPSVHSRKMEIEDLRFAFAIRGAVCSDETNILASDESRRSWWQQEMPKRMELGLADILIENKIPGLAKIESGKARRVLLTGRPCTGKSTLGRKIARGWANGSIIEGFDMVYVLDSKMIYSGHDRSQDVSSARKTLQQMTATSLISEFRIDFTDDLEKVIDHNLDLDTTLLIIDVATTGDFMYKWIQQAMQRSCSLLVLRDPISAWRGEVKFDVELELIGLTDDQMIADITEYFEGRAQTARDLKSFLGRSPDVRRMAHHPLTLETLCHMWDNSEKGQDHISTIPRSALYSNVIHCITMKRTNEFGRTKDQKEFLYDLQSAVFNHLIKSSPANWTEFDGEVHIPSAAIKKITSSLMQPKEMDDVLKFKAYFFGKHIASIQRGDNKKEREHVDAFLMDHMYESTCMTAMCIAVEDTADHAPTTMELLLSFVEEKAAETIGLQPLLLKLTLIESFLSADEDRKRTVKNNVSSIINTFIALIKRNAEEDTPLWKVLVRQLEQMPLVREAFPQIDKEFKKRLKNGLYLSSSSFESAARLFRGASPFGKELMKELIEDYPTASPNVQQQLILCISCILTHAPDASSKLMSYIKQSLEDSADLKVRIAVLERLDVFISASPKDKDELIDYLQRALRSDNQRVAKTAWRQISKCIQLFSDEQKEQLWKEMKNKVKSEESFMRGVVMEQIGCVFKAIPSKKMFLIDLLRNALNDKEEEVLMAALEQIPYFQSNELQKDGDGHPLRRAFSKKNHRICKFVVRQLKHFVEAVPSDEALCMELLKEGLEHKNKTVHETAVDEIPNLCSALPHRRDDLFELWRTTVTDGESRKFTGIKQIGAMTRLVPERKDEIRDLLMNGIHHTDENVKQQALLQIPEFVCATDEKLPGVLVSLNTALRDKSSIVREAAHKAIQQTSLAGLIELAWIDILGFKQEIIKEIGYRLLDAAVTVTPLPDDKDGNCLRLTAYTWSGKVEWDRLSSSVKDLVRSIVKSVNDEYPELCQMPKVCE